MAVVICTKCGAKNRVDERADQLQPVCGRCGAKLNVSSGDGRATAAASGEVIVVTDATFTRDVLGAGNMPVLLDCWAPWCGPCKMLAPVLKQVAHESRGRYIIAKLNTDENPTIASQFRIDAIPTMLLFKNGALVDRLVGLVPKAAIEQKLSAHV